MRTFHFANVHAAHWTEAICVMCCYWFLYLIGSPVSFFLFFLFFFFLIQPSYLSQSINSLTIHFLVSNLIHATSWGLHEIYVLFIVTSEIPTHFTSQSCDTMSTQWQQFISIKCLSECEREWLGILHRFLLLTTVGRSSSCRGPVGCGWWWWSTARRPGGESCWAVWEPTDCSS